MLKKIILIVVLSLFLTPLLFGDGLATINFNYINDLVGAKAAAMGGAYTAISDDPSGSYYNPAGIAYALNNQISLSVNSYKHKKIEMENTIYGQSYIQETSSFYPSFFGVVHKLGKMKFAFTLITKNNELLDQDGYYINGPDAFNINYNLNDSTSLYNISGAGFISENLTFGVTITGLYRRNEEIAHMTVIESTNYFVKSQYITEEYYGLKARVGFQWMPTKNISLGLSAEAGIIVSHNYSGQTTIITSSNMSFQPIQESSDFNDGLPINIRLGFAYFPTKKFLFSADIIADIGNLNYSEHVQSTLNGAIGMEYYLTPTMPIRFGLFSNMANTPVVGGSNIEMHVNLYGASMGLGWESRNSSISITGTYQYGKGEAVPGSFIRDTIINKYTISLTGTAKY